MTEVVQSCLTVHHWEEFCFARERFPDLEDDTGEIFQPLHPFLEWMFAAQARRRRVAANLRAKSLHLTEELEGPLENLQDVNYAELH